MNIDAEGLIQRSRQKNDGRRNTFKRDAAYDGLQQIIEPGTWRARRSTTERVSLNTVATKQGRDGPAFGLVEHHEKSALPLARENYRTSRQTHSQSPFTQG